MKHFSILFFSLITITSFSQTSIDLDKISTFKEMGQYCFDIQNNIDSYSKQEFLNKQSNIDTVFYIIKNLKEEKNTEDLERWYNIWDNQTLDDIENDLTRHFIEYKELFIQQKKKGRFRFLDFSVNRKSFDGLELYNLWIEYEIIGRPKETRRDLCFLFFIHDERFYLVGFD